MKGARNRKEYAMARKDVANLVGGAGLLTGIFTNLVTAVTAKGGTAEDIHRLTRPEGQETINRIAEAIVAWRNRTYRVQVDYSQSIAEMVKAGKFDTVPPNFRPEQFPISGHGMVPTAISLLHFNRPMTSESVVREMGSQGLRPAMIEELLTLGTQYPDLQRHFQIMALGSMAHDGSEHPRIPALHCFNGRRELMLLWYEADWDQTCYFAAVPRA